MSWGLAQAGDRAGKTGRYLQWWENKPEWVAVTSGAGSWHDSTFFCAGGDRFHLNTFLVSFRLDQSASD